MRPILCLMLFVSSCLFGCSRPDGGKSVECDQNSSLPATVEQVVSRRAYELCGEASVYGYLRHDVSDDGRETFFLVSSANFLSKHIGVETLKQIALQIDLSDTQYLSSPERCDGLFVVGYGFVQKSGGNLVLAIGDGEGLIRIEEPGPMACRSLLEDDGMSSE